MSYSLAITEPVERGAFVAAIERPDYLDDAANGHVDAAVTAARVLAAAIAPKGSTFTVSIVGHANETPGSGAEDYVTVTVRLAAVPAPADGDVVDAELVEE